MAQKGTIMEMIFLAHGRMDHCFSKEAKAACIAAGGDYEAISQYYYETWEIVDPKMCAVVAGLGRKAFRDEDGGELSPDLQWALQEISVDDHLEHHLIIKEPIIL